MVISNSTTYSTEISDVVQKEKSITGYLSSVEVNQQIDHMTKNEVMDHYLEVYGEMITGPEISSIVKQIFGIDVGAVPVLCTERFGSFEVSEDNKSTYPLSIALIDSYLKHTEKKVTGTDIRNMINHFLGVNLDGVASLEKARISLYSKGQWVVRQEKDLFAVYTGTEDVDVKVYATAYFTEQTGLKTLPKKLQQSLTQMGFYYHEKMDCYYYSNPTGEAVPDAFKGQTIGFLVEVVQKSYADL